MMDSLSVRQAVNVARLLRHVDGLDVQLAPEVEVSARALRGQARAALAAVGVPEVIAGRLLGSSPQTGGSPHVEAQVLAYADHAKAGGDLS